MASLIIRSEHTLEFGRPNQVGDDPSKILFSANSVRCKDWREFRGPDSTRQLKCRITDPLHLMNTPWRYRRAGVVVAVRDLTRGTCQV
jgi:hypothetical protein